ncbi:MAG: leucine--tRNA ligase [Candidatus Doudnabacteria bacterium CG10_big_fil_rev_8_21_14_0_10_41_10]|uniref:Leucine--tRNA ligase n=1 Tax=Candidatus Doudnabacteria bacterium CG10_big_fil_rev_8_21_14_0_10_41_10 TaxID=1974551 RepID=A0A2H0VFG7_9BACT|nr:MAG: leucine--tRNA ligase [Candidatus Doudnabacteria bacterium CG10_big_fil_rev_8_21_14_0_10_41_10]
MKKYDHKKIERKWQKFWEQKKSFAAKDFDNKKKYYALVEFPYPSGDGLHVGHVRSYAALDAVARYKRMDGYNVLYPIGFDAFGLPTENFAIKHKIHPRVAVDKNIKNFTRQLKALGLSYDWDRMVDTTDPKYYKWTQWIFLQLYKAGLAVRQEIPINWCPSCKTGLANEEVINGKHERCGTEVTKKLLKQWVIKITKYADRLLLDLALVDYPERVKTQQINWIGKSEGAEIVFPIVIPARAGIQSSGSRTARASLVASGMTENIQVFTTRADTLFGATYLVVAPEHPVVASYLQSQPHTHGVWNLHEVKEYVEKTLKKNDILRTAEDKEKTGVELKGLRVKNPLTGEALPVWTADYVIMGYGTGAIMAVPAHDERDYAFAKKFKLPIKPVIEPVTGIPAEKEEKKEAIVAVVRDSKTKNVLMLDWGPRQANWGGMLFIGGGVEAGESDLVKVAQREIAEETGYTQVSFIGQANIPVNNHFYSNVKNRHYVARMHGLLFELKGGSQTGLKLDSGEHGKFKLAWVPEAKVVAMVSDPGHALIYRLLTSGDVYTGEGTMVNSGKYSGLTSEEGRRRVTQDLEKQGAGKQTVSYKLRDWIFSRQHYWGEPIPIIYCPDHGEVPVPEKNLPVLLPKVKKYEPTDTGESPLAGIKAFVNVKCPICKKPARRETDTMPNWAGSNWYFIRYADPKNAKEFASRRKMDYWLPVDLYNGGMEHTTLHLLYSRFIYKFLYDQKLVPNPEPYARRRSHGIILASDGRKMSKSFGNVINPDDIVGEYGADTLRMYELFIAPFDQMVPWADRGVVGVYRFLMRVWNFYQSNQAKIIASNPLFPGGRGSGEAEKAVHKLIKKITSDLLDMKFNTAVAAFMETINKFEELENIPQGVAERYLILLAPFAPHMAEEIWQEVLGHKKSIHTKEWPKHNEKYIVEDTLKIVIQVNGRTRDIIMVPVDLPQNKIENQALASLKVEAQLQGKTIVKTIYVKGRLVNFVIK